MRRASLQYSDVALYGFSWPLPQTPLRIRGSEGNHSVLVSQESQCLNVSLFHCLRISLPDTDKRKDEGGSGNYRPSVRLYGVLL